MSAAKKPSTSKKATAKAVAKKATPRKAAAKATPKQTSKKTPSKAAAKSGAGSSKSGSAKATQTAKKTAAKTPRSSAGRSVSKPAVRSSTSAGRRAASKAPAKASRPTRPAKLDKKALAAIKKQLIEKRSELEQRQAELQEDSFDGTQSDITGEVGLDEDFADAGTATFERERDLSIRNNISDLVDQMTRAIARIDDGTYGTCERCGRPIDAARLKELPHALLCLDCKRREERAR